MKAKIGIITIIDNNNPTERTGVSTAYVNAIVKTGGVPLLLPFTLNEAVLDEYAASCDGFLFSGGIDISPCCYQESPHLLLGSTSLRLDRYQLPLIKKVMKLRKPFLAICRGHQLLNVACNGTLYQDISEISGYTLKHTQAAERQDVSHLVQIKTGTVLANLLGKEVWTNSYHHQSVKQLGDNLVVSATAEDGIIEAIELQGYPYGIGIQWHPEMMFEWEDSMRPLFEQLVYHAKNGM